METISLQWFLHHFCEEKFEQKKFCFILGSGASVQSEIPTGGQLVHRWLEELKGFCPEDELNAWKLSHGITTENAAEFYSTIYDYRYKINRKQGYEFLEKLMDGKEPSCGYSVLAEILTTTPHNVVITTNFDSLTEDALFIYTKKKPLIVGHEALANFIRPFQGRPAIIKIHRDVFFSPISNVAGTSEMMLGFQQNLADIFKFYTPLVIGYGGNDGSLMNFLENLPDKSNGLVWFSRGGVGSLAPKVKSLVEAFNGFVVTIEGFDEFMIQLGDKLQLGRMDAKVMSNAEQRVSIYLDQIKRIKSRVDQSTKEALTNMVERSEKDWWYFENLARREQDPNLRISIYENAIKELKDIPEMYDAYASYLAYDQKNFEKADQILSEALAIFPNNLKILAAYGSILYYAKNDPISAQEYFERVIDSNPLFPSVYSDYANLLTDAFDNREKARAMYEKAIEIQPLQVYVLLNYIEFLCEEGSFERAAELIKTAEKRLTEAYNDGEGILLLYIKYAVFYKTNLDAALRIEDLLKRNIKIRHWDLSRIAAIGIDRGHPDPSKVKMFAEKISNRPLETAEVK